MFPADIINWENIILTKGFYKTYLPTVQDLTMEWYEIVFPKIVLCTKYMFCCYKTLDLVWFIEKLKESMNHTQFMWFNFCPIIRMCRSFCEQKKKKNYNTCSMLSHRSQTLIHPISQKLSNSSVNSNCLLIIRMGYKM